MCYIIFGGLNINTAAFCLGRYSFHSTSTNELHGILPCMCYIIFGGFNINTAAFCLGRYSLHRTTTNELHGILSCMYYVIIIFGGLNINTAAFCLGQYSFLLGPIQLSSYCYLRAPWKSVLSFSAAKIRLQFVKRRQLGRYDPSQKIGRKGNNEVRNIKVNKFILCTSSVRLSCK